MLKPRLVLAATKEHCTDKTMISLVMLPHSTTVQITGFTFHGPAQIQQLPLSFPSPSPFTAKVAAPICWFPNQCSSKFISQMSPYPKVSPLGPQQCEKKMASTAVCVCDMKTKLNIRHIKNIEFSHILLSSNQNTLTLYI